VSPALFFHDFSTDRCFVIGSKYASHLIVKKPDNKGPKADGLLQPAGGKVRTCDLQCHSGGRLALPGASRTIKPS
jgi:hypothetical protein